MPAYVKYPNSKETSSRKTRKSQRNTIFVKNSGLAAKVRKEKKAAKRARQEALENEE